MSRIASIHVFLVLVMFGVPGAFAQQRDVQPGRVLVMPFENVTHDGRIIWMGEASSVLLADDLNAFGVSAITREERQQAFDVLQVPPNASLTDATVIRIGQIVGAAQVVVGTVQLEGDDTEPWSRSRADRPKSHANRQVRIFRCSS